MAGEASVAAVDGEQSAGQIDGLERGTQNRRQPLGCVWSSMKHGLDQAKAKADVQVQLRRSLCCCTDHKDFSCSKVHRQGPSTSPSGAKQTSLSADSPICVQKKPSDCSLTVYNVNFNRVYVLTRSFVCMSRRGPAAVRWVNTQDTVPIGASRAARALRTGAPSAKRNASSCEKNLLTSKGCVTVSRKDKSPPFPPFKRWRPLPSRFYNEQQYRRSARRVEARCPDATLPIGAATARESQLRAIRTNTDTLAVTTGDRGA
jgi:hypothetical protein